MAATWDQRDPDEQARVRDRLLADWLPTVVAAAPFWGALAEASGIAAADAGDLGTLRRLPTVRETELLAGGDRGSSAVVAPTEDEVRAHAPATTIRRLTAGIGRRGAAGRRDLLLHEYQPLLLQRAGSDGSWWVASSRSDLDRMHRAGARSAAVAGVDPSDVLVSAVRCGPTLHHLGMVHLAAGASITAAHPRTDAGYAEVVDAIRALSPTVLAVAADEVDALADALRAARVTTAGLRRLLVLGPPPDEARRKALAGAFTDGDSGVPVLALWGPTESRVLWAECAPASGLHTYPDLEHLEVVDPFTGAPTEADGDLTLTSLGWHGTALVRYRTGAWVEPLVTGACPGCGRTLPRLGGTIEPSAWQLPFRTGADVGTVDLRGVASVLSRAPGVVDWRVEVVAAENGDHLRVEVAGGLGEDGHELRDRLAQACGMVPEVRLGVAPDEIAAGIERVGGVFADLR
ncbi:phenylacetate--CoA ligase family protein [Egicoccus sp. AB-alg6-2]|uniref:phenylacetate--CoA ligase family protein n=1 Tax=Egicoccus sp. AB-alg6-2 TaxID=3242692 RepID=UPI00359EB563